MAYVLKVFLGKRTTWVRTAQSEWSHQTLGFKMQTVPDFFASISHQKHLFCRTSVTSFLSQKPSRVFFFFFHLFIHFPFFSCFTIFAKKEKKQETNDPKKHFLNWKPNAGYTTPRNLREKKNIFWFVFLCFCFLLFLFTTCQVRAVRFYVSFTPPPPSSFLLPPPSSSFLVLPPSDLSCKLVIAVPRQTQTASLGSECSPPDLNRKLVIALFPAGPEQQAQDQSLPCRTQLQASVPCRTRTASSGPECFFSSFIFHLFLFLPSCFPCLFVLFRFFIFFSCFFIYFPFVLKFLLLLSFLLFFFWCLLLSFHFLLLFLISFHFVFFLLKKTFPNQTSCNSIHGLVLHSFADLFWPLTFLLKHRVQRGFVSQQNHPMVHHGVSWCHGVFLPSCSPWFHGHQYPSISINIPEHP